ncbi:MULTISPECIES: DUF397 domain-containing protein [unclassified Streptomyces]|uniref:DUF397 domain-containing protein n=1 Tax=unclassified Streptomyces TaxID=2593676 RepID=UPI003454F983
MSAEQRTEGSGDELRWFKSSYSGSGGGDCVEVAVDGLDAVCVRDSKAVGTGKAMLRVGRGEWAAFVALATAG